MTAAEFFSQPGGFLAQTLPIALLCFAPFGDSELKFPRRRILLFLTAGLILLSAGYGAIALALFRPSDSRNYLLRFASVSYMGICLLLGSLVFLFSVRATLRKKILVLLLLVHYAAVVFTLNSVIANQFFPNAGLQEPLMFYDISTFRDYLLLTAATAPFVYCFLKRVVRVSLPMMENRAAGRTLRYLLAALLIYCTCVFFLANFEFHSVPSRLSILAFLAALILTDILLYFTFFYEVYLSFQNQQLADQLRSFDARYREISANIEESRRARHDIRHHLNVIGVLNRQGKPDELNRYLQQYEAFCEELENLKFSGWPSFDNILRYYTELAKSEGITVETDIQPFSSSPAFDVIDMTVITGNLMENAIEACRRAGSGPHFIRIWIRLGDASLLMRLENSCPSDGQDTERFTDGSQFVSHKRPSARGYGLKSIRYVAGKYGGSAEFCKKNGIFTARIVLNIPSAPRKKMARQDEADHTEK